VKEKLCLSFFLPNEPLDRVSLTICFSSSTLSSSSYSIKLSSNSKQHTIWRVILRMMNVFFWRRSFFKCDFFVVIGILLLSPLPSSLPSLLLSLLLRVGVVSVWFCGWQKSRLSSWLRVALVGVWFCGSQNFHLSLWLRNGVVGVLFCG
jgi:hypothetical protein